MILSRKCLTVDERVYADFQELAKEKGLSPGGMLRHMVRAQQGKPDHASKAYSSWLKTLVRVGRNHGPAAAEKYCRDYPAPR